MKVQLASSQPVHFPPEIKCEKPRFEDSLYGVSRLDFETCDHVTVGPCDGGT